MTPDEYIAATPEPKRSDLAALHRLILTCAPSLPPYVAGKLIGYGKYRYRYDSGREGESCRVGLASSASGISLYVACVDAGGWLAEQWKGRLGKADVGKSCIRFKRLADVDLDALTSVLKRVRTLRAPGEVTAAASTKKAAASTKKAAASTKKAAASTKKAAASTKKAAASTKKAAASTKKAAASTKKAAASTKKAAASTKKAAASTKKAAASKRRAER